MKITLYRADWEPFKDCSAILDYPVDTVLIEDAGCTLEVTESITGTKITIKQGSARIVNMAVVDEKLSSLYHYNDIGQKESPLHSRLTY